MIDGVLPGVLTAASRALLLESVVVHANDAVVITQAEPIGLPGPRIIYANPAFTRMTGYTSAEVVGKSPRILQGPETSAYSRARIREALTAWRPIVIEMFNYRRDGQPFWVELSITPVADETGYFTHWISVQRDITERRNAEEAATRGRIAAEKRIALLAEIEQRERVEARLAYSVVHDDLTGLYNRSHFIERISAAVERTHNEKAAYSVIHLDLNRFRYVNDRLGYRIGDRVLRDLAKRVHFFASASTTVARIGGANFGLLIEHSGDTADVLRVAETLLLEISARPPVDADDVVVAASIGIVHLATDYWDAEAVLRDSDTALVRARQIAGNAFVVFTGEMRDEADVALHIRNDLYGAVARNELRLYYQPLVDIALNRVYGFEALVRWQHPTRGLVSPADFIPIAEATGLIIEIGRWVLFESCRMARELQRCGAGPILMSINVSCQQLLHSNFVADLQAAIDAADVDPGVLQLEITESVFLAGAGVVGTLFTHIRAQGVRIALDDFGTGYSSLSYLESFQIDTLKIDQSFVGRMDDISTNSEIVRMIIGLAHALGVDVVAEGVETRAQRTALGRLGCTHLQGYLYSRPLPPAHALELLADENVAASKIGVLLHEAIDEPAPAPLSPFQREELRLQVQTAFDTHRSWMERLHTAVSTGHSAFDLDHVAREDLCPIGIWLNTTISEKLRRMPLYYVTKARHAVFHRSMARLLAAVNAGQATATTALRRDGNMAMAAASLVRTLHDWLAIAEVVVPLERPAAGEIEPSRHERLAEAYLMAFQPQEQSA